MRNYFTIPGLITILGCTSQKTIQASASPPGHYITTSSGLQYSILREGTGETARAGQEVLIFETTSYLNGRVLYSNENTTKPVKVLIGGHQATQAVDEGLQGMRVVEIRKLIAKPGLVKRTSYPPNVSPDSPLTIKIILHQIL